MCIRDSNKTKKAKRPKPKTGSPRKLEAKSVKIHKDIGDTQLNYSITKI